MTQCGQLNSEPKNCVHLEFQAITIKTCDYDYHESLLSYMYKCYIHM